MFGKILFAVSLFSLASAQSSSSSYDFVVVGGGTAGLAIASRLSQKIPQCSILVIEAGAAAPDEPGINIPGLKGSTLFGQYDWSFLTTPQTSANGRVVGQSRGKVLGGSSALNFMVWDRASKPEYDSWQQLGNPGWNWNSMLPAMLAAENFTADSRYGQEGVATGGPVQTLINRIVPEQQLSFIPTLNNLGIPSNLESLNGNPLGVMYQPNNIRESNYTRSYSVDYLRLAGSNVHIMTNTQVQKVNMQRLLWSWLATGVTLSDGTIIRAEREVILAAGAFQSPQILEASGIGNSAILSAAGIATKIDLKGVGENLQDHIYVTNAYQLKPGFISFDSVMQNATYAGEQMALYQQGLPSAFDYNGSGYVFATWGQATNNTAPIVSAATASAKAGSRVDQKKLQWITDSTLKTKVPQLEVLFADGYTGTKGYPASGSPLSGAQFITLLGVVQHTFARGSVHINPATPNGSPVINPNYLNNAYDLKAAVEISKFMRKIAQTAPLKDIIVDEYEPGLNVATDEQFADYVKTTASTLWHPMGTCAMMPRGDGGVVNNKLLVYGTKNLRVVDASVIPIQISAHMQTAIYGIAEIAAEIIGTECFNC